ncbi:MAG: hypothetical protein R3F35_07550 [Myxococcota bacterium]
MNEGRSDSKRPARRGRRPAGGRSSWILAGPLGLGALALACIANPIRVDARDPKVLAATGRFSVSLAPTAEGTMKSADEATTTRLLDRLEDALASKGYSLEPPAQSELALELGLHKERVSRKTYSSDPDASGVRMVERTEAILTLRAVDHRRGIEIWRCDARGRLPEPELAFVESEQTVWNALLERALEAIPSRRRGGGDGGA